MACPACGKKAKLIIDSILIQDIPDVIGSSTIIARQHLTERATGWPVQQIRQQIAGDAPSPLTMPPLWGCTPSDGLHAAAQTVVWHAPSHSFHTRSPFYCHPQTISRREQSPTYNVHRQVDWALTSSLDQAKVLLSLLTLHAAHIRPCLSVRARAEKEQPGQGTRCTVEACWEYTPSWNALAQHITDWDD